MPGFYSSLESYYAGSLSRYGGFGVDVFFGISGLLITYLLLQENERFGSISLAGFYTRRAFRILPPCFLYLCVVVVAVGVRTPLELVSCVFFFRDYLPQPAGSNITFHLWSLSVEEHFYLLWPLLLVFVILRRAAARRAVTVAWIAVFCALWRVADAQNNFTAVWFAEVPVHFRSDLRMDALLWGCFAAFVVSDDGLRERLRRGLRPPAFFGVIAVLIACIGWYSQLTSLWVAMLIPLALAGTVLNPQWVVSRMLDHAVPRFIGRMSYSLYLWQQAFLISGWEPRSELQRFPQNLVLTFVCAYLSYRFLEKPCMSFGQALSARICSARLPQPSLRLPAPLRM